MSDSSSNACRFRGELMKTAAMFRNRLWICRLSGIAVCVALLASATAYGGETTFRAEGEELLVQTPAWTLALDAAKGAIRRLEDRRASGTLLRGGPHLWVIQRHKQPDITSSDCALKHAWDATAGALTLEFDGPEAAVSDRLPRCRRGPGLAGPGADQARHDGRLAFSHAWSSTWPAWKSSSCRRTWGWHSRDRSLSRAEPG